VPGAGPFGNGPALAGDGITVLPSVPASRCCAVPWGWVTMPSCGGVRAGSPLPKSVFDGFKEKFGVAVTQLYGATEIGSVAVQCAVGRGVDSASVDGGCAAYQFGSGLAEGTSTANIGSEGQVRSGRVDVQRYSMQKRRSSTGIFRPAIWAMSTHRADCITGGSSC